MEKKKMRKKVRFNYFVPYLVNSEDENENFRWTMKEFVEFFLNHKHEDMNTAVPLGDEIADMEWNTAKYDDKNDIYYFQLSKNRSKNIPSKKKLNHDKVSLELDEDEYISEFVLLVYDARYNILIVQSNYYSLSTSQVQIALSILRQRVKDFNKESEHDNPRGVYLKPLIDSAMIKKVKKNTIYRRIAVKGADFNMAASDEFKNNSVNKAITALKEMNGVSFNIELSMSREKKGKSLDKETVRELMDEVTEADSAGTNVSMSVTSRAQENAALETINLIEPRLTSAIEVVAPDRSTIAAESLYTSFCEQNYLVEGSRSYRDRASRISGSETES
ncbi:DUF6731 family protein [Levilactobacillus brevis]|uniref:DUF6731 family protein n=1 Tax=Levilactobacillus brevis TaxID=1580 RepID=UPI0030D21C20